jgi:hypothetical protein
VKWIINLLFLLLPSLETICQIVLLLHLIHWLCSHSVNFLHNSRQISPVYTMEHEQLDAKASDGRKSSTHQSSQFAASPQTHRNETESFATIPSNDNTLGKDGGAGLAKGNAPSNLRQNLFMVFITLTQLVQMVPLGAGINSSFAIGAALGATQAQSVWIVASYPLTQGTFVLIGA